MGSIDLMDPKWNIFNRYHDFCNTEGFGWYFSRKQVILENSPSSGNFCTALFKHCLPWGVYTLQKKLGANLRRNWDKLVSMKEKWKYLFFLAKHVSLLKYSRTYGAVKFNNTGSRKTEKTLSEFRSLFRIEEFWKNLPKFREFLSSYAQEKKYKSFCTKVVFLKLLNLFEKHPIN